MYLISSSSSSSHHHHHHYISVMELGHLLTRSGLTYPEVSSKVYHDSFCQLGSSISLYIFIYVYIYIYLFIYKTPASMSLLKCLKFYTTDVLQVQQAPVSWGCLWLQLKPSLFLPLYERPRFELRTTR